MIALFTFSVASNVAEALAELVVAVDKPDDVIRITTHQSNWVSTECCDGRGAPI